MHLPERLHQRLRRHSSQKNFHSLFDFVNKKIFEKKSKIVSEE
jgi:hypothetical protein